VNSIFWTDLAWLVHCLTVFYMTGVIWQVQIVHYPLFKWVGGANFKKYHELHTTGMGRVVGPMMILQFVSAVYLFVALPLKPVQPLIALSLSTFVFVATFFVSVPLHSELSDGFEPQAYFRLVQTNWARTILWTGHSFLSIYVIAVKMGLIRVAAG
jgi:hypothetical protein